MEFAYDRCDSVANNYLDLYIQYGRWHLVEGIQGGEI